MSGLVATGLTMLRTLLRDFRGQHVWIHDEVRNLRGCGLADSITHRPYQVPSWPNLQSGDRSTHDSRPTLQGATLAARRLAAATAASRSFPFPFCDAVAKAGTAQGAGWRRGGLELPFAVEGTSPWLREPLSCRRHHDNQAGRPDARQSNAVLAKSRVRPSVIPQFKEHD